MSETVPETAKVIVPVFVFLINGKGEGYFQQRHSVYMNGYWESPAGKLNLGESLQAGAVREALEEAGVVVDPDHLHAFYGYLNANPAHEPWLGVMFWAMEWEGVPRIMEPEKCSAAGFYPLDKLPEPLTPQVRDAIPYLAGSLATAKEIPFAYYPTDEIG